MSYTIEYEKWGDTQTHTKEIEAEDLLEVYKQVNDIPNFKRLNTSPINNNEEL